MTAEQLGPAIITTEVTPTRLVSGEAETRQSIGVALLIVAIDPRRNGDNTTDPLIWTLTELQAKAETEKTPGEISIPAETKKVGEYRVANILGALAEFCDDNAIPHLADHLFLADGFYREKGIIINSNPVDLAVLVYNGPLDISLAPQSSTEVIGNGWINRSRIRRMDGVRSVLTQAVEIDALEGLTSRALEAYYTESGMTKIFSPGFSMRSFYEKREILPDVSIYPRLEQA
ncbi:MAG: hypothetical protein M1405_03085 [Patescibacteria group bacterium]|nr:hypothetical protein [Patescibacteria group bacterium]